jgi:hypothetical protein
VGAQIVIWTFYDQVVKVEKGWEEQEFVLLIIAAFPSEAGLPNEYISCRIKEISIINLNCYRILLKIKL